MDLGELELQLSSAQGAPRATLWAAATPGGPRERSRWQQRPAIELTASIEALVGHPGAVRVTRPLADALEPDLAARVAEVCARRGDALVVLQIRRVAGQVAVPLELPLRIDGLVDAPGPRFDDGTRWAMTRGVLVTATAGLDELRQRAPHVLHVGLATDIDALADRLATAIALPRLIVLEGLHDQVTAETVLARVQVLGELGCPAVLAVTAGSAAELDDAVTWLYRKLAHDCDLDDIGRELIGRGHRVVLALADDAQRGLSLRRAVLEAPRGAVRLAVATLLDRPARRPVTELEVMLAASAARAMPELAQLAANVLVLRLDQDPQEATLLEAIGRTFDTLVGDVGHALAWQISESDAANRGGVDANTLVVRAPPVAMPARTLRAFLHQDLEELDHGVVAGTPFALDVALVFRDADPQLRLPGAATPLPLTAIASAFTHAPGHELELVVWAPGGELEVALPEPARTFLPSLGESAPVRFELIAAAPPDDVEVVTRRLRIAAYHHNALVQALSIDLAVAHRAPVATAVRGPVQVLDYALSDELLTLDRGPVRHLSVIVDDDADGNHRIGARTADDPPGRGIAITLDHDTASRAAAVVRDRLRAAGELDDGDRYAARLATIDAGDRALREERLIELAQAGHRLHAVLFASYGDTDADADEVVPASTAALAGFDGHIEIARCGADAPTIPWPLVYDLPLQDAGFGPRLCPLYLDQLRRDDDLLDRPRDCARQRGCPHARTYGTAPPSTEATPPPAPGAPVDEPAARPDQIVCPFGFWGVRHRVAQPVALRGHRGGPASTTAPGNPPPIGDRPPPATTPAGERGVTIGYYDFDNAWDHITRLAPDTDPSRRSTRSATNLTQFLVDRRDAIIYFYAQGAMVDDDFLLELGDADSGELLGAGDLIELVPAWQHAPFVIVNGAENLTLEPPGPQQLVAVLRRLGAAAIIGPTLALFPGTAALVGERLVLGLLAEIPPGELLVAIRRDRLRELDPMALAYDLYAPSGVAWTPSR